LKAGAEGCRGAQGAPSRLPPDTATFIVAFTRGREVEVAKWETPYSKGMIHTVFTVLKRGARTTQTIC